MTNEALPRSTPAEMRTRENRFQVEIQAPRQRVWEALTQDIGRWWPRNLVMGPAIQFRFDAVVGGHLWEDYGDDGGLIWATIKSLRKGSHIAMTTDVFPELGGPARSIISYILEDIKEGTRLTWSEARFGRVDDDVGAGQWLPPFKYAVAERLKAYVEGKPVPGEPSFEEART